MLMRALIAVAAILINTAVLAEEKQTTVSPTILNDPSTLAAEEFFTPIQDGNFRISPDGKYLAFTEWKTTYYVISVTDLEKFEMVYSFSIGSTRPSNFTWISGRRLLFGVAGDIRSVNVDGTDLRVLISHVYDPESIKGYHSLMKNIRYWSIVDSMVDNSEEILVSSYDRNGHANAHRINVFTGEKEDLFNSKKLKANSLYMNRKGEVVLATREKKRER
jgi:hypothetical protein